MNQSMAQSASSAEEFYRSLVEADDLAFDIGANVGEHALAMWRNAARVIAVEPQQQLAARLKLTLPPDIEVVTKGVGRSEGEAVLRTSSGHPHLATFSAGWPTLSGEPEGTWDGQERCEMTTLDALIDRYGIPRLLKLDTEGYEHFALQGLHHPVERILFEVHRDLPMVAGLCFDHLRRLGGYEFWLMTEESWQFTSDRPLMSFEIMAALPQWGDVYARRFR